MKVMEQTRAKNPFLFVTRINLIELTGLKARTLPELVAILKTAPSGIVYQHTHHFLKQHQFLSPEPPNDFAYWVTNILQEEKLGERLASIDTIQFKSLDALGQKIIDVIEGFLNEHDSTRTAPEGEELHFMRSTGFV